MKWKRLAANLMSLVMIKKQANTFFMIALRKALQAAEVLYGAEWATNIDVSSFDGYEFGEDITVASDFNVLLIQQLATTTSDCVVL